MMAAVTDVARFCADRLDEDEQVARTARDSGDGRSGLWRPGAFDHDHGRWYTRYESGDAVSEADGERSIVACDEERDWSAAAEHIARHDPARALAFVAAGRAILAEHEAVGSDLYPEDPHRWCATCPTTAGWPCPTVRALASVWADHDAYDPAWKVET